MKRIIIAFMITICLLMTMVFAHADTSTDTILGWIEGQTGNGERITSVELEDRVLAIHVDLGDPEELYDGYAADLADTRTQSITDELLEHDEFDAEWDIVRIEYSGIGCIELSKDDIEINEYNLRYFNIYDDNWKTKMK